MNQDVLTARTLEMKNNNTNTPKTLLATAPSLLQMNSFSPCTTNKHVMGENQVMMVLYFTNNIFVCMADSLKIYIPVVRHSKTTKTVTLSKGLPIAFSKDRSSASRAGL